MTYTKQQIEDWRTYERVRASSHFNMFDPKARRATGLSENSFVFVISHYSELAALAMADDNHTCESQSTRKESP